MHIKIINVIPALVAASLLLLGACSSGEPATQDPGTDATLTTTTTDAVSTSAPASAPTTDSDLSVMLIEFGRTWDAGDWEAMSAVASDSAVATAQEWRDEGGSASIDEDRVKFIIESCSEVGADLNCQLVYGPAEGFGLIFSVEISQSDGLPRIETLTFQGDAG